jgi:hypothetical protein
MLEQGVDPLGSPYGRGYKSVSFCVIFTQIVLLLHPGWTGSFGCPQDIDTIAFPTNNTALAEVS